VGEKHRTVITYLEMNAPPARTVPPPALPLAIIRAQNPPVHFYRYLYESVGGPWVWVERRRLDDDALEAIITDERVEIYLVHVDGVPAGFGELDFRAPGRGHLAYFGLVPEYIGRGIGPYFLDQLVHMAWSHEIEQMTVNTCTLDHPSALALYQKSGFAPVARRETVIEAI
jgi:GNAT superfamily N-acetyltransferase